MTEHTDMVPAHRLTEERAKARLDAAWLLTRELQHMMAEARRNVGMVVGWGSPEARAFQQMQDTLAGLQTDITDDREHVTDTVRRSNATYPHRLAPAIAVRQVPWDERLDAVDAIISLAMRLVLDAQSLAGQAGAGQTVTALKQAYGSLDKAGAAGRKEDNHILMTLAGQHITPGSNWGITKEHHDGK